MVHFMQTVHLERCGVREVASLTNERMENRKILGESKGANVPFMITDTVEEAFP